jgi:hypothetical protein
MRIFFVVSAFHGFTVGLGRAFKRTHRAELMTVDCTRASLLLQFARRLIDIVTVWILAVWGVIVFIFRDFIFKDIV